MRTVFLFALLLAAAMGTASAQAISPKQLFETGASAYIKGGAASAIEAWIKGSALEGNTQATSQANSLRQIEDFYGKPEGYEVVLESKVSERSAVVLAIINYHKGPLFFRLSAYRLANGNWITAEFKINTEVNFLFPDSAVYRR